MSAMRLTMRRLSRAPGYALAFVMTLGLGLGANTAIFTALRGVLISPLPHRDGGRIVYLRQSAELAGAENALFSVPEILDYREAVTALSGFAEYSEMTFNMLDHGDPVRVLAGVVSGNYFDVMGLGPAAGRVLDPADDGPEASPVLVLSHDFWTRAFGAEPDIVGESVRMNGRSVTIVGVVQAAPSYPRPTDVFVNMVTSPHHLGATMLHGREHRMTEVFARLAPGQDLVQAQEQLGEVSAVLHEQYPEAYDATAGYTVGVTPLRSVLTREASPTLWTLMATASLVLLIAAANVVNLTLIRGAHRSSEIVVRRALGADAWKLRRFVFAENLVLSLVGVGIGLLIAYASLDLLVAFVRRFTPRAQEIHLDVWMMLAASFGGVLLALGFTLVQPLAASSSTTPRRSQLSSRSLGRFQRRLVVGQVAMTFVLLTSVALVVRSLVNLYGVEPGADLTSVLTIEVPANETGRTDADVLTYYQEIRNRTAEVPGVAVAALGSTVPLKRSLFLLEVEAEGRTRSEGEPQILAEYRTASPEYFDAAGIPLVGGRAFQATDHGDAPKVAILNETLAARLFPGLDPIGGRIRWTGDVLRFIPVTDEWRTVVGVVSDTRDGGPDQPPVPVVFQPFAQEVWRGTLVTRVEGEVAPIVDAIRRLILELDPSQPIENVQTLAEIHGDALRPTRLNATLLSAFGALALIVAAVGIGGVLGFSVSRRTGEIGVRMSLGADRRRVRRMVLGEGLVLLILGLAIGALGSIALSRLITGLLFGVAPLDPVSFTGAAATLLVVGIGAATVPARRASAVQINDALRRI